MPKIYLLPISEAENIPEAYCAAHFPQRFARSRKFLRHEDVLRCIGAGALLHGILGLEESEIRIGAYGKPYANTPFNLSHSGKYVLLAVDTAEIGADIEAHNPHSLSVAKSAFLPEESAWMNQVPSEQIQRFYTLWTLKESVMKLFGLGLRLAPDSFSVLPLVSHGNTVMRGQTLYAHSASTDGHTLSVCAIHCFDTPDIQYVCADMLLR